MTSKKIVSWLIALVMGSLLVTTGCTQEVKETAQPKIVVEEEKPKVVTEEEKPKVVVEEEKPKVVVEEEKPKVVVEEEKPKVVDEEKPVVELTLKYTPQDSTTYKFTSTAVRGIKWEGPSLNDAAFRGGKTSSSIEMTFTQQIQSTDDKGNAVAKITIENLKHHSIIRDEPVVDFESSRAKDQNSPLARLIGQSYTIKITPTGRVLKVIDVSQAEEAVQGTSPLTKTALAMLSSKIINERHSIPSMPYINKNQLRIGDNWNRIKAFSFGLMGSKTYERIYTLKEVKETDNRRIAIIEMEANPTAEMAEKLHKEQAIGDFSKMFENTETYTGQLKVDLTAGKVEKCIEKLESEWIAVEPMAGLKDEEKEPAVLTMTAMRLYSLEKID